jgi:sodium-dependent dicarboxylate transporter 2/3/5
VHLPEEMIGLAAGLALFILPSDLRRWEFTVDWRDALAIDWGTIILFGGGMTLGQLIFSTGLANTVSDLAMKSLGMPGEWSLIAVAIVLSIALSELASNTASANVMLPLMIGLAQASHVPVIPVAIATSLASSFGFMLPVSTPPNAIVYGSGRVPLTKMIVTGVIFDVVGAVAIWCLMRIVAPIMR